MARWGVYSGGNGYGAFQAGVNQFIVDHYGDDYIDNLVGISAGAINAAAYATGSVKEASEMWTTITEDRIIKRRSLFKFALAVVGGRLIPFNNWKNNGLHDTRPLLHTLEEFFNKRKVTKRLWIGRVDLWTGKYNDSGSQSYTLGRQVWQSTLIPIIMRPDVQNTALWVDGGVHNTRPLMRVVEDGMDGDDVIIVNAHTSRSSPKPMDVLPRLADMVDIGEATLNYLVDVATIRDTKLFMERNELPGYKHFTYRVVEPAPSFDMGSSNDYSTDALSMRYQHGYERAKLALLDKR